MDQGDSESLGWGNGPTSAQEVDLAVGIDAAVQMEGQMQVQQGGGRARADYGARFDQATSVIPSSFQPLPVGSQVKAAE